MFGINSNGSYEENYEHLTTHVIHAFHFPVERNGSRMIITNGSLELRFSRNKAREEGTPENKLYIARCKTDFKLSIYINAMYSKGIVQFQYAPHAAVVSLMLK